ncbi:MAG TPA: gamma-glutamyl-gamma-aminobutyrate hydrolase family protein [Herpetosiphonaceae bacterium]|nr:gamma-glutamyl-gamma-aminobutyrate hydrolase family protein [Herpetosiphonaceae bacterium]
MHVLLLDNDDPSTQKLEHYLRELGATVDIHRNDEIEVDEVRRLAPAKIILSPGPDMPSEAGIVLPLIRELSIEIPILGIGLGHQAIAVAFGGRVIAAPQSLRSTSLQIEHNQTGIFTELPSPFEARNDSILIVERAKLPDALEITAWDMDGRIMGLRHRTLPVHGIQFYPGPLPAVGLCLLRGFLEQ